MSDKNSAIVKALGLNTQPNELSAPEGSLAACENMEITRDNVAQMSIGFEDFSTNLPDFLPEQIFSIAGTTYAHTDSGLWYYDTTSSAWLRKQGSASATQYTAMTLVGSVLYLGDNTRVYAMDLTTGRKMVLAGTSGSGTTDGTGTAARFSSIGGIAYDGSSTLYVTDNQMVRTIVISTAVVTTIAGTAATTGITDATGASARFNNPTGCVWVASSSGLFIADKSNHSIRKCTSGGVVTTHAGLSGTFGSTNGTLANSRYNLPSDLTLLGSNLYVMDTNNSKIRTVPLSGNTTDLASVSSPVAITNDGTKLYSANNTGGNSRISTIDTGGTITVVAGGSATATIVDGIGTAARFSFSTTALGNNLVSASDRLYILDVANLGFNRTALREMYYATSYVYSLASGTRAAVYTSPFIDGFVAGPS